MQITWTNCADKMPPDENIKIIAIFLPSGKHMINYGHILNSVLRIINRNTEHNWKWTPYTQEKWEYLNK